MSKQGGGVWGLPKMWEHFSWTFDHFQLFKSSGRKDGIQKPNTFSEANKMKFTLFCRILQNVVIYS